jgi:hypothetical protein
VNSPPKIQSWPPPWDTSTAYNKKKDTRLSNEKCKITTEAVAIKKNVTYPNPNLLKARSMRWLDCNGRFFLKKYHYPLP